MAAGRVVTFVWVLSPPEFKVSPVRPDPRRCGSRSQFPLCHPVTFLCPWLGTSRWHQKMNTILSFFVPAQSNRPRIPRTGHMCLFEKCRFLKAASSATLSPLPKPHRTSRFSKSGHSWWVSRIELLRCFSRVLAAWPVLWGDHPLFPLQPHNATSC